MEEPHNNPNESDAEPGSTPGPVPGSMPGPMPDARQDPAPGSTYGSVDDPLHDPDAEQSERTYSMWIHLGALIAWLLVALPSISVAGMGFWAPVAVAAIMWTVRKNDSPFIDDHGREALNFQISLIVMAILVFIVGFLTCTVGWFIGGPALFILGLAGTIMGATAASKGQYFRYPATFRFLKG